MVYHLTGVISTRLKFAVEKRAVKRVDLCSHLVKKMYVKMIIRSCVAYGGLLAFAMIILLLS